MLYIIYQEDGSGGAAIRARLKSSHLDYPEQHKDILVLRGAMLDEDGVTRTGSVLILNLPDRRRRGLLGQRATAQGRRVPFR